MPKLKFKMGIPPLIIIGAILVIFPIFAFMTIDRINRQQSQSAKLLFEKGTALIRAFEAGTYSGMMNTGWDRNMMENLLEQTAALPDIVYLFIVNNEGIIIVHNKSEKVGQSYGVHLDLSNVSNQQKTGWRIKQEREGKKIFEVYKKFSPITPQRQKNSNKMMMMHQHFHEKMQSDTVQYEDTVIFVGLDMDLIEQADKGDTQHTIMMAVILALIGLTGFVLVFIVQRYTQTKSSLNRVQIFSDNLVENMPIGLIAADINNQIISVNPVASSILKIQPGFNPMGINTALPTEIKNLLLSGKGNKNPIEKEIKLKENQESPIILETIASPLHDKEDVSLGTLLILRDKTELHRLRTEMEENKRLAAIGRLAGGVAHEIRNPLSSLKGYATFFKETFDPGSENFSIADTMTKEVDRLNRVISELVELARPVSVSGNPVDLEALVVESVQLVTYEPDAKNIEIKTVFDPGLPEINADADRLKQVLLNLCLNALQAMQNPGVLEIKLRKTTIDEHIVITISDTGCGIKKDDLSNIFEPYFTTKQSGTGLGLAIVHNIIKAHKGRIAVESQSGKGTVFTISLPIRIF